MAMNDEELAHVAEALRARLLGQGLQNVWQPARDRVVIGIGDARILVVPRGGHSFLGRRTEGPADTPRRFQAMAHERMSSWYIPVETIMLGHDRTVWIGMRPAAEGRPYLVLNAAGDPVGTVTVPRSTRVRQARADRIWVTETDDDGLSSVVRYRVIGLQCGRPGC